MTAGQATGQIELADERTCDLVQHRGRVIANRADIRATIFIVIAQHIVAKVETCRDAMLAESLHVPALSQCVILTIGEHDTAPISAVGVYAGSGRNCDLIVFAVDADAGAPRSFRKQVGALDHSVAAAIDVQSQSERSCVVCIWQIGGTLGTASEEGIVVDQILAVSVDGEPEQIAPIDSVTYILKRGDLRLHQDGVVLVSLMAHRAVLKLAMPSEGCIQLAVLSHHSHRNTWHGTGQHFAHLLPDEIAPIAAQVENVLSWQVHAQRAIDRLSRLGLFAVVVI
ncbi:hypothetical protein ACVIHD_007151 [Bradyrhizobium embrapense]